MISPLQRRGGNEELDQAARRDRRDKESRHRRFHEPQDWARHGRSYLTWDATAERATSDEPFKVSRLNRRARLPWSAFASLPRLQSTRTQGHVVIDAMENPIGLSLATDQIGFGVLKKLPRAVEGRCDAQH